MERLVAGQVRPFWFSHDLLCEEQHGFMVRCLTVNNLLRCDTLIANYRNNNEPCDLFLLDFSRAFEKVDHTLQIEQLYNLNIAGNLLGWIQDFLSNRFQQVLYTGAVSAPKPVTSGVIQGFVLGPLLFLGFINDLQQEVVTYDMLLFADDSKAVAPVRYDRDQVLVQRDLTAIGDWSIRNHLPLCIEKSACLHYGFRNR